MNRTVKILLTLAVLPWQAGLSAQTFDVIERRDFWNAGRNVNGVREDTVTVSYAELYGSHVSGGNRDVSEAKSEWRAGLSAGTITHLDKFSMIGKFSFADIESRGMCGSMSARPGYYPVEAYEFTPGRKTRQIYSFAGGVAVEMSDRWLVGGRMDFEAQNYTKRKDLRHTNYLLDMTFAPSVMWRSGDVHIGASGIFSKNSETITAEELGITSGVYYAFLDKGLMYGVYDIWDNSSLHIKESGVNGFPVKEISGGAALQIQWRGLYADAEFLRDRGNAGEKQKIWYDFGGYSIVARADYKLSAASGTEHYFRGRFAFKSQSNDENVLEDVTEGGVTITRNYGSNRIFVRNLISAGVEWEEISRRGDRFFVGVEWNQERDISSVMFPYAATRKVDGYHSYVGFVTRFGRFDLKVRADARRGWCDDGMAEVSDDIAVDGEPYRQEDYYAAAISYRTAKMGGCNVSLRYNFRRGVYLEAGVEELELYRGKRKSIFRSDSKFRIAETLKIGYNF